MFKDLRDNPEKEKFIEAAREYAKCGYSIIPVGKDKRPLVKWGEFQQRRASYSTLEQWFSKDVNMAVVTGKNSGGLCAIDFDSIEFFEEWFCIPAVREAAKNLVFQESGRGMHVFFKFNEPLENKKLAFVPAPETPSGRKTVIETRGDGGYILVYPSIHSNGKRYKVLCGSLRDVPVIDQSVVEILLNAARSLSAEIKSESQLRRIVEALNEKAENENSSFRLPGVICCGWQ